MLTIHYHHWRASDIISDLYLGEKKFPDFVQECQLKDEIISEPWIEGCVIIDRPKRQLWFWTVEFTRDTTVREYYLAQLSKKWPGWDIQLLNNQMYDAEKVLGIDYSSQQEYFGPGEVSEEDVLEDNLEDGTEALVIIKEGDSRFVTKTGNLSVREIVVYGEAVIPLLKDKPAHELPREEDKDTFSCIVIDPAAKRLVMNESSLGLWEHAKDKWKGFSLTMGDYGYIATLRHAGIDTSGLTMSMEKVLEQFKAITEVFDGFDPHEMAGKLLKDQQDITFNPDFFDEVRPKPTLMQRLGQGMKKLLGLK